MKQYETTGRDVLMFSMVFFADWRSLKNEFGFEYAQLESRIIMRSRQINYNILRNNGLF